MAMVPESVCEPGVAVRVLTFPPRAVTVSESFEPSPSKTNSSIAVRRMLVVASTIRLPLDPAPPFVKAIGPISATEPPPEAPKTTAETSPALVVDVPFNMAATWAAVEVMAPVVPSVAKLTVMSFPLTDTLSTAPFVPGSTYVTVMSFAAAPGVSAVTRIALFGPEGSMIVEAAWVGV